MTIRKTLRFLALAMLAGGLGLSAAQATAACTYATDPHGNAFPTLYERSGFRGERLGIHPDYAYRELSVSDERSFDDRASSVCVPDGYTLELYTGRDFRGRKLRIVGPAEISSLRGLQYHFDDAASSARVVRVGLVEPVGRPVVDDGDDESSPHSKARQRAEQRRERRERRQALLRAIFGRVGREVVEGR